MKKQNHPVSSHSQAPRNSNLISQIDTILNQNKTEFFNLILNNIIQKSLDTYRGLLDDEVAKVKVKETARLYKVTVDDNFVKDLLSWKGAPVPASFTNLQIKFRQLNSGFQLNQLSPLLSYIVSIYKPETLDHIQGLYEEYEKLGRGLSDIAVDWFASHISRTNKFPEYFGSDMFDKNSLFFSAQHVFDISEIVASEYLNIDEVLGSAYQNKFNPKLDKKLKSCSFSKPDGFVEVKMSYLYAVATPNQLARIGFDEFKRFIKLAPKPVREDLKQAPEEFFKLIKFYADTDDGKDHSIAIKAFLQSNQLLEFYRDKKDRTLAHVVYDEYMDPKKVGIKCPELVDMVLEAFPSLQYFKGSRKETLEKILEKDIQNKSKIADDPDAPLIEKSSAPSVKIRNPIRSLRSIQYEKI